MLNLDLESRILRALCSTTSAFGSPGANDAAKRASILAMLRAHSWQDPEHRVVYEALAALPGRRPTDLREQLPAQATRMGFPEVNWQKHFAAPADDSTIESLVADLLAATGEEEP